MAPVAIRRPILLGLLLLTGVLVLLAPGLGGGATAAGTAARPSNFKIVVNGKTLTAAQLAQAADTYITTRTGRTLVAVRWRNTLRGSGYYVLITNSRQTATRKCTSGTSCIVRASTPLVKGDEISWSVQIKRRAGNKLVTEKVVCLIGKS
jgi:hypothetical protein